MEEKATVFAAGAVYAYLKYGLTPVFLGINFRADGETGQLVTEHLSIPFYRIDEQMTSGEVIGVLSRMTAVVSMSARAHLCRRTGRAAHRCRL